ncbi:ATP-binding protein [Tunicatimonas pelagia]|uniref:ATP-binding protein n=1 Tax=Tunicatimonas pelagia TaxID=931531 RepID=UPI0026663A95|nr:ATP-binding protein [Tunicatimonas pelagia]WKN41628.1 ATP-binding protein [Tunicatimonas pelagia]
MIKERTSRLLNEEKEIALLLSRRGELLFLNTAASEYFEKIGVRNTATIYSFLSPDTEAVLRQFLSQGSSSGAATINFKGVLEGEYTQSPIHFWLSRTATSQEDIFIVILEILTNVEPASKLLKRYKAILDDSPVIVSVYNANFNCIYVNRSAYYQLGHSLGDYYANDGFLQFVEPSDRPAFILAIEKDTQNRVQFSKYYYLARKKSGELVKITNFITRVFQEDGQLNQIVANEQISFVGTNILTPTDTQEELILADAHYHIHYISQNTKELLGGGGGNPSSLFSVIHPDDHAKLLATQSQQNDAIAVTNTQLRIIQPSNSIQLIDATIHRFFNVHGQMVYIAIRWLKPDSSEEHNTSLPAADEKNQSQELEASAENLSEGTSFFLQQDLTISYSSPMVEEVLGYTSSELQGQDITTLIHESAQELVKEQLATAFSQPEANLTCLIKKKDSTYQPFDLAFKTIDEGSGPPILFIRLRAMSFANPKLSQLVLDHLPDAVFLLRYSDLSIIEANSSAVALLQENHAQLVGTEFLSLWDAPVAEQLRIFLSQETEITTQDIQYTTHQGHSFWGNTTIRPMISGSVPQKNIIVLRIVDVTDRKAQEIELQKHSVQESISVREKFLSEISHEIRTPLNAVLGMTHLMLQSNPREDQKKMLQTLKFSGDNLTALINDLLDLSKIKAGQLKLDNKEFNLIDFIQGVKSTYRSLVSDRGILFRLLTEDEVPTLVMGDVNRLGQVLNNLLSNAVKFTEEGQIVLSVYVEKEEKERYTLLFEVADTGIGIPEDKLTIIFEPYQQAGPSKYGGTGLGLSIVKSIVELQGGKISVQSTERKGTTFRVALPFGKSAQFETTQQHTTQSFMTEFQSLEGLKVLYVEDVIPNQLLMEGLSDKWDVQLDTALNGLEALQKVKNNQYDLILMDIQMPEMDGYEATREIRNLQDPHYENIPIIALTASVSDKTRERIQEMGMNDYIPKPINPKSLHQKLAALAKNRPADLATTTSVKDVAIPGLNPDFSQLRELYLGDSKGYIEILEQIQRLTLECFPVIISAVERKDEEVLRFNCHKIMSYIRLLHLNPLERLLDQAKEYVDDQAELLSADNIVQQLTRYFDKLEQHISDEITEYS